MMEAAPRRGGHAGRRPTTLCDVGVDVLLLLVHHLDIRSLARLEQTCKTMQSFVLQHGWSTLVARRARSLNAMTTTKAVLRSSTGPGTAKETIRIDHAWATRTFVASQCSLNSSAPFCQLHLLPHGLVLLMRSELRYWSAEQLQRHAPISMDVAMTVRLENPANLDDQWRARQQHRPKLRGRDTDVVRHASGASAKWDVCASAVLDSRGELIALGRMNGLMEVISLQRHTLKQEALKIDLRWIWRDLMDGGTTIQTMTACPHHSGLLMVCSKHGDVWLMTIKRRANNARRRIGAPSLDARPLHHWKVSGRVWSACFGGRQESGDGATRPIPAWLAIGTTGASGGVLLFSMCPSTLRPTYVASLRCGGVSVYALKAAQTTTNDDILYAGCYDGKVRTFRVGTILQRTATACDFDAAVLKPERVLFDRFDPNAVYSLCLGVGEGGQHVAAGTSRHGIVKIFRPSSSPDDWEPHDDTDEDDDKGGGEGWSMFAAHPSRSPTYALAGQHDRLFGVTDEKLWQIDLRPPPPLQAIKDHGSYAKDGAEKDRTLAYYEHGDMVLATSIDPGNLQ